MQQFADLMLKKIAQSNRGSVVVEFAMVLPVLLLLYIGGSVVSDMIACSRKVTIATRSLVDLVTRTTSPVIVFNSPQGTNAASYLSASAIAMAPYKLRNSIEQISLLRVCDDKHAYVVWTQAQTQSDNGASVTPTASTHTAGTLPTVETQSANTVISIPSNMITSSMVPASPDGSNVCANLAPGTGTKVQVGTAGGWLYTGTINYNFTPAVSYLPIGSTMLDHTIYMVPRLY